MKTFAPLASGLAFALVSGATAHAQDGLVDRNRLDRRPDAAQPAPTEPAPDQPLAAAIAPFVLTGVRVEGSSLPRAAIDVATAHFIGQTLDAQGVARLHQALTEAYAKSPVALPALTVDTNIGPDGVLRFVAVENGIRRVAITGETDGNIEVIRHYAASLTAETPLTRRTAERYFSLISDLPGVKTTVRTAPVVGSPGRIDLGLEMDRTDWEFGLGVENRGSSSLGRTQVTATAARNGAFRLGDQTALTVTVPTEVERFQYVSVAHRQPIGWDGAAVTASVGYLRTRPESGIDGDATTASVTVSWPMIRSYRQNLVLSAGLDGVNSDSALFGELVAAEHTRVARASAAWSKTGPRTVLGASGVVSQGIDGLGAEVAVPAFTDLDFLKLNARASATRAIGQTLRIGVSAAGQWSDDRAPATEQFTLGGGEFGRAFSTALLAGDSGWGAKAEVAWRPTRLPAPVAGSELYVFGDTGEVTINDRPGFQGRDFSLASAGLGVRVAYRKTVVEIEGAKAVDDPRVNGDDWRLGFGVSTRF